MDFELSKEQKDIASAAGEFAQGVTWSTRQPGELTMARWTSNSLPRPSPSVARWP